MLTTDPTLIKIIGGSVISAILTVGGLSYSNKNSIDTHDLRISRLERTEQLVTDLTDALAQTNTTLAVTNERLKNLKEQLDNEQSKRNDPR